MHHIPLVVNTKCTQIMICVTLANKVVSLSPVIKIGLQNARRPMDFGVPPLPNAAASLDP